MRPIPREDSIREYLMQQVSYDMETGEFTWLKSGPGRPKHRNALAGSMHWTGYKSIRIGGTSYLSHRLAYLFVTGHWPPENVDHINRDRSDNRWSNLREATFSENSQNSNGKTSIRKSKFKGTYLDKRVNRWTSSIRSKGKRYYLGYFDLEEDAAKAYAEASILHHGDFSSW